MLFGVVVTRVVRKTNVGQVFATAFVAHTNVGQVFARQVFARRAATCDDFQNRSPRLGE